MYTSGIDVSALLTSEDIQQDGMPYSQALLQAASTRSGRKFGLLGTKKVIIGIRVRRKSAIA